ncbi:pilin [bacterium]|nr:pilin [bacterium]
MHRYAEKLLKKYLGLSPQTKSNQLGFTLIELMASLAIVGILAAIATPYYADYKKRAFDALSEENLHAAARGEETYYSDNERYVDCIGGSACETTLPGYAESVGVDIAMFQVPAAYPVPEYFTGRAFHPKGKHNALATAMMWNSNQGGLQ